MRELQCTLCADSRTTASDSRTVEPDSRTVEPDSRTVEPDSRGGDWHIRASDGTRGPVCHGVSRVMLVGMRTEAAVLWEVGGKWEVEEIELNPPGPGEVLVELAASGLCHSDEHLLTGDLPAGLPMVGGARGCRTGAGDRTGGDRGGCRRPGRHDFLPSCGRCSYCVRGYSALCDDGAGATLGPQLDGTYRVHARGEDVGQMCLLGTLARHTVVPRQIGP